MSAGVAALLVGVALVTSVVSGILGMAGGAALLGVMATLLPARDVVPLHGVVQLASNGTRGLALLRHVRWRYFAAFAPGLAFGVAGAGLLYRGAQLEWFRPVIGALLLGLLWWRRKVPALRGPPLWSYTLLGAVAGFLAIFVGATGPFLAPFFFREDLEKEEVIGTKAACQVLVHLAKLPAFLALGYAYEEHAGLLAVLVAAVVVGTLIGRKVLGALKGDTFRLLFEIVLAGMGAYLIGSWLIAQAG